MENNSFTLFSDITLTLTRVLAGAMRSCLYSSPTRPFALKPFKEGPDPNHLYSVEYLDYLFRMDDAAPFLRFANLAKNTNEDEYYVPERYVLRRIEFEFKILNNMLNQIILALELEEIIDIVNEPTYPDDQVDTSSAEALIDQIAGMLQTFYTNFGSVIELYASSSIELAKANGNGDIIETDRWGIFDHIVSKSKAPGVLSEEAVNISIIYKDNPELLELIRVDDSLFTLIQVTQYFMSWIYGCLQVYLAYETESESPVGWSSVNGVPAHLLRIRNELNKLLNKAESLLLLTGRRDEKDGYRLNIIQSRGPTPWIFSYISELIKY